MRPTGVNGSFDIAGVGIGPSNLSTAALLQPLTELRARFFDRRSEFQWHGGLLFSEARIQVSFLKDLVTLADPTNPCSFLSFLYAKKRMYRYMNANFGKTLRKEFNQYYRWVSAKLDNLEFGANVEVVEFRDDRLMLRLPNCNVSTRHLILGSGLTPRVPECAGAHLGPSVFHASEYLDRRVQPSGMSVTVIGGGQSGAEVVLHLLSNAQSLPREVLWFSRRSNFQPLDESPFTNELFTPSYSEYFFGLPLEDKARLLEEQRLASDGIDTELLEQIYRRLYELEFLVGEGRACRLYPGRQLVKLNPNGQRWILEFQGARGQPAESVETELVVLATGSEYKLPHYLDPILDRITWGPNGFAVRRDFSIEWDGPDSLRIFVHNATRRSRGIADPNLSLMAWRSGTIINSIANRRVYEIEEPKALIEWDTGSQRDKTEIGRRRAAAHGIDASTRRPSPPPS